MDKVKGIMPIEIGLPKYHPMMKAWDEFQSTDEFKSALRWSVETKYDDGRPISDIQREQHARWSMWLAFTKGIEVSSGGLRERQEIGYLEAQATIGRISVVICSGCGSIRKR